jgi:hypothetical protein
MRRRKVRLSPMLSRCFSGDTENNFRVKTSLIKAPIYSVIRMIKKDVQNCK